MDIKLGRLNECCGLGLNLCQDVCVNNWLVLFFLSTLQRVYQESKLHFVSCLMTFTGSVCHTSGAAEEWAVC